MKELQEERRHLEEKKEAEKEKQLERKRSFMEREARKRAAGKVNNESKNASDEDGIASDGLTVASSTAPAESDTLKKPAWCQSETDREASEMDEEAKLLDFVDSLDFDQYSQDLELQTLMDQVKERIKTLERDNKKDGTKLQTCLDVSDSWQLYEILERSFFHCLLFLLLYFSE